MPAPIEPGPIIRGINAQGYYIWRVGSIMLLVTCVQVVFAIAAVYFGSRAAMACGRDIRAALFLFCADFTGRKAAMGCDFNWWMQHLISEYREEDVVDEVSEEDLLHGNR